MTTMTNAEYHAHHALGSTTAQDAETPRKWVMRRTEPRPEFSAATRLSMAMGTALHSLVLEGADTMREGVTIDATGAKREDILAAIAGAPVAYVKNRQSRTEIAAARAAGRVPIADDERDLVDLLTQQAAGERAGLVYLDADSIATVRRAHAAVQSHPAMRDILDRLDPKRVEQSRFVTMPVVVAGVLAHVQMKARPDAIIDGPEGPVLVDLKSLRPDIRLDAGIERVIRDRGYHMQAEWYATVHHDTRFAEICHAWAHMGAPFDCRVTRLGPTYRDHGQARVAVALASIVTGERWLAQHRPDVARHPAVDIGEGWTVPDWCPGADVGVLEVEPPRWAVVEE